MDHWGSLQSLSRKQQAEKRRKAEIRTLYTKRRKKLIQVNSSSNEYNFPKLSKTEFIKFKSKIRKEYRLKKISNYILSTLLFIIILFTIIYLFLKKGFI